MEWDKGLKKEFRKTSVLAMIMLGVLPIALLVIAFNLQHESRVGGETDMMFYILLMVAIAAPATAPLVQRFHISMYRSDKTSKMSPGQLLTSINISKFAFVEAAYIMGLMVYFTSGDIVRMLYFYPIGIAWSVAFWPRRSVWEKQMEKLKTP